MDTKEFSSLRNRLKEIKAKTTEPEIKIVHEIENYQQGKP